MECLSKSQQQSILFSALLNTPTINPILCWILNIFHFQIICTNILTPASLSLLSVMKNEFILLRTSVWYDVITRLADCLPDKQFYRRTLKSCVSGIMKHRDSQTSFGNRIFPVLLLLLLSLHSQHVCLLCSQITSAEEQLNVSASIVTWPCSGYTSITFILSWFSLLKSFFLF